MHVMMSPSPWAKIQQPESSTSFVDITSEQLAKNLQEKFNREGKSKDEVPVVPEEITEKVEIVDDDTDSDTVIANMLQMQYDQEYDLMLKRTEAKFNRDSKVNVSYSNFRTNLTDPDDQKDNVEDENRDFDRFVSLEKEVASMPRCGYKKVGEGSGEVVTKHDILMSSRINACRVLEFPPGIQTGDTGGFDVKLDNKVYNSLRRHSHAQCSRNKAKVVKQTASSK